MLFTGVTVYFRRVGGLGTDGLQFGNIPLAEFCCMFIIHPIPIPLIGWSCQNVVNISERFRKYRPARFSLGLEPRLVFSELNNVDFDCVVGGFAGPRFQMATNIET